MSDIDDIFDDIEEYDEDAALEYIRERLPEEVSEKYDDNNILDVVELVFDFYESKGFFQIVDMCEDEESVDKDELDAYICKRLSKRRHKRVDDEDIPLITTLEMEYEKTLSDF